MGHEGEWGHGVLLHPSAHPSPHCPTTWTSRPTSPFSARIVENVTLPHTLGASAHARARMCNVAEPKIVAHRIGHREAAQHPRRLTV